MKYLSKALMALSVIFLFFTCKSNKYSADTLPDDQLHFGTSGGFAGITSTYILLENGQLFYQKSAQAKVEKKDPLKKKIGRNHFAKAEKINWEKLPDTEPGNLNYFIIWKKAGKVKQYNWSGKCPDENIDNWFSELDNLTK